MDQDHDRGGGAKTAQLAKSLNSLLAVSGLCVLLDLVNVLVDVAVQQMDNEDVQMVAGVALGIAALACFVYLLSTVRRLNDLLGWGSLRRIALCLSLFVPPLNLLVLLAMVIVCRRRIQAHGMRVGLFGVTTADLAEYCLSRGLKLDCML